jgi:hypothetical protein
MDDATKAAWKRFADALDAFKGTGLGAELSRAVVGHEPDGRPICRYCAIGAAYRAAGHNGAEHSFANLGFDIEQFFAAGAGAFDLSDAMDANDKFRGGSVADVDRYDRLAYMRAYSRARARGCDNEAALRAAAKAAQP